MSNNSNNNNSGGLGSAIGIIFIVLMLIGMFGSCGSDGESAYERDLNSGFDKWTSGDFGSMTTSEKRAVDDFLEWSNNN